MPPVLLEDAHRLCLAQDERNLAEEKYEEGDEAHEEMQRGLRELKLANMRLAELRAGTLTYLPCIPDAKWDMEVPFDLLTGPHLVRSRKGARNVSKKLGKGAACKGVKEGRTPRGK